MLVFWILAALMIVVALAFVLVPLLRARAAAGPTEHEANLAVLRGQRAEIEADVASGVLPREAREEALAELVTRAQTDLAAQATATATRPLPRPTIAAAIVALALPAAAIALYVSLGTPGALDAALAAKGGDPHASDQEMAAMVDALAVKVRERPDDPNGWALLARSSGALGRFRESAEAYERLAQLVPGDPDVLADYADALAMAQGQSLAGKPYELVKEALKIDPGHRKSLALAGTASLNAGDFPVSLGYWERLAAQLPPGSEDLSRTRSIIAEVRERSAAAGKPLPASPAASAPPAAMAKAAPPKPEAAAPKAPAAGPVASGAQVVTGTVSVDADMAGRITGSEALYIFARAEGGPRIPLAVVRATAKELPRAFRLDDSMAMSPGMTLSSTPEIRIEARVSRSGNAQAQSGDLVGTSDVVKPGARDVKIVINRVLP